MVDEMDDEMELTEFYTGGGSQSVDCEASPPALQVINIDPTRDGGAEV